MGIDALLKNFNTETEEKILDLRGSFVLLDCCALHTLCYMPNEGSIFHNNPSICIPRIAKLYLIICLLNMFSLDLKFNHIKFYSP